MTAEELLGLKFQGKKVGSRTKFGTKQYMAQYNLHSLNDVQIAALKQVMGDFYARNLRPGKQVQVNVFKVLPDNLEFRVNISSAGNLSIVVNEEGVNDLLDLNQMAVESPELKDAFNAEARSIIRDKIRRRGAGTILDSGINSGSQEKEQSDPGTEDHKEEGADLTLGADGKKAKAKTT